MKLNLGEFAFFWGTDTAALHLGWELYLELCNATGPLQHSVKPAESWDLLCSAFVSQIKIQALETTGVCRLREINGTTSQKVGEMEGDAQQYLRTLKGTCWWCTSSKKSVLIYSGGHNSAEWHFVFCNNIKLQTVYKRSQICIYTITTSKFCQEFDY